MGVPPLAWIGIFTSVLLVVWGGLRYRGLRLEGKILFWFFALSMLIDSVALYLFLHRMSNAWLYGVHRVLEYAVIMYVLSFWQVARTVKSIFLASIPAFFVLWLGGKFLIADMQTFDNLASSTFSLLLVASSCYTMVVLTREHFSSLLADFRFWVVSGTILIHATGIILFAATNLLMSFPRDQVVSLWSLHWVSAILANFMYMRGFLCKR